MKKDDPAQKEEGTASMVLLVQPEQGEFVKKRIFQPGVEIPLNLACLAAFLEREGIPNRILDLRLCTHAGAALEKVVRETKPFVVGISAFTSEIGNAIEVARRVKALDQNIFTVLGGHHASAQPVQTLQDGPWFDCLVIGEGEITLIEVIRTWKQRGNFIHVHGIAFRESGEIRVNPPRELLRCLDDLPFPARDKLELNRYVPNPGTGNFLTLPSTGIMASRGCPYKCRYCSKGVWGDSVRFRSIDNVVAEIEHCIERYGIRDFRFFDDNLTLPQWDLKQFCRLLIDRKINIHWNCYSRVSNVTVETLQLMKEAGCYHIKYGIEFGTEKALRLAGKGANLEQARRAVSLTREVGIECKGNFILGIPGEEVEDCQKTIAFARELSPDLASFYPFDFFPGSRFYQEMQENSHSLRLLPREVTERLASRAYRSFYFRPAYFLQRARRVLHHPSRELKVVTNGLQMMLGFYLRQIIGHPKKNGSPSS